MANVVEPQTNPKTQGEISFSKAQTIPQEKQGKLVTSITQRTNKAHLNLLRNGSRRAISETEYQQFLEAAQKLWNF